MNHDLLGLIADVDQDRAALETWWKSHTDEEKLLVWEAIVADYRHPVLEVMSRFAQLAFTEAAIRFSGGVG